MKISVVIPVKDEEKNIGEAIKSVSFCDEVIVIDDMSSDKTVEIAKNLGARVLEREMKKNFSNQLNFGMKRASEKWILFLDADERVTPKLRNEIEKAVKKNTPGINGFWIKRQDFFLGKRIRYGDAVGFKDLRLVRKGSGKWKRRVHPHFDILGRTKTLKGGLVHYPHESVSDFIDSINTWSNWHSLANREEKKSVSVLKIVFFPLIKFIRNYFFKLGFLDGLHGFVHAFLMSFHSFLAWSNLWIMNKKK